MHREKEENGNIELDVIPHEAYACAAELGLDRGELLLACKADKAADYTYADTYLFLTHKDIFTVSGRRGLQKREGHRSYTRPQTASVFSMTEGKRYALRELTGLRVEELLSGVRLTALEGEVPVLLAVGSGFSKRSLQIFCKYADICIREGHFAFDPEDSASAHTCPTCGTHYPDKNREYCPRCAKRGKLFLRMGKFFLKYKLSLVLMMTSLLVLTAAGTVAPYLSSGFFYDSVLTVGGEFYGKIMFVLILVVGTRLISVLATMLNNYITSIIAAKVVYDLKKTIFGAIERLSLGFFTARQTGGLMTQVSQDANTIYTFFCDGVPYFIINAVQVLVLAVLLFTINPLLAALSLCTVPVFFLTMRWLFRNQSKLHARRYSGSRRMNSFLADVLSGMRVVKAFSREKEEISRFDKSNTGLAGAEQNLSVFNNYAWPITGVILYLGNIIAWAVGGWMVMQGTFDMTYGKLVTFIAYVNMIYSPLYFFVHMVNQTADCSNAMRRLFEIADARPEVSERDNPVHLPDMRGDVTFSHVDFSYAKNRKIIDDVSFHVPAGQTLGIVGHTGAGKSTLANLLMRLYDTERGDILIDGVSVRDLAFADLHGNIAIVSQETYLFIGTVLDNIRYARPDATHDEVLAAARMAGCHDFIMKLPDAYETRIGFGYKDLSGGERQRLSIARAILRNPKILILDEATAAMDTETERRIQAAIERLTRGKTTIVIAHRLSTLRDADSLIVIESGRVAEAGTQEELLAKEGVYHKLYTLQEEALKNAGIAE